MKRSIFFFAAVAIFLSTPLCAQSWTGLTTGGNVGIGTTTTAAKLNIENYDEYSIRLKNTDHASEWLIGTSRTGWGAGAGKLAFTGTGNSGSAILTLLPTKLGVGNINPRVTLDVGTQFTGALASVLARLDEGDATGDGTYMGVRAHTTSVDQKAFALEHGFYGTINSSIAFYRGQAVTGGFITFSTNNNSERMRILRDGTVGIGTATTNGYRLAVEGTIGAREVTVNTSTWADYVFNNDYELLPLTDLEKYIAANHHLPEVPTAAEVEENGIRLGEMNALLLKKVEELTLHIIRQEKRLNEQEEKIKQLSSQR